MRVVKFAGEAALISIARGAADPPSATKIDTDEVVAVLLLKHRIK